MTNCICSLGSEFSVYLNKRENETLMSSKTIQDEGRCIILHVGIIKFNPLLSWMAENVIMFLLRVLDKWLLG